MSIKRWRFSACMAALCVLSACGSATFQLDALTPAEPSATRERAMRRLSLATAYYEQNQNTFAVQEVRSALQIDPQFAQAYSLLGLIHQRDNAPQLAQQSFEQALQLASITPVRTAELAEIQHNYGWFLCEQNQFAKAQVQFDSALSQANYRYADKTAKAMALCQQRALVQALAPKRND